MMDCLTPASRFNVDISARRIRMSEWELALGWRLPLRPGALRVSAPPLLTMACHCTGCQRMTRQRLLAERRHPRRGLRGHGGRAGHRRAARATRHFFCRYCMSWMFTRPRGWTGSSTCAPTMLDDPGWFAPFIETWTSGEAAMGGDTRQAQLRDPARTPRIRPVRRGVRPAWRASGNGPAIVRRPRPDQITGAGHGQPG